MLIIDTVWHEPDARRKFFESYAKQKGFDPLIPENWYKQSRNLFLGQVFFLEQGWSREEKKKKGRRERNTLLTALHRK
jgi:hypothetical protein